jgi:HEAT repeat protein
MRTTIYIWMLFALPFSGCAAPQTKSLSQEECGHVRESMSQARKVDRDILHRALISDQTYSRARAARLLGESGDAASVPHLIDALGDQSVHVGANYPDAGMATTRYWANESLKKLTKRDFGFVWSTPASERQAAIKRWRDWYQSTK